MNGIYVYMEWKIPGSSIEYLSVDWTGKQNIVFHPKST
jgi:hypothetical protein